MPWTSCLIARPARNGDRRHGDRRRRSGGRGDDTASAGAPPQGGPADDAAGCRPAVARDASISLRSSKRSRDDGRRAHGGRQLHRLTRSSGRRPPLRRRPDSSGGHPGQSRFDWPCPRWARRASCSSCAVIAGSTAPTIPWTPSRTSRGRQVPEQPADRYNGNVSRARRQPGPLLSGASAACRPTATRAVRKIRT